MWLIFVWVFEIKYEAFSYNYGKETLHWITILVRLCWHMAFCNVLSYQDRPPFSYNYGKETLHWITILVRLCWHMAFCNVLSYQDRPPFILYSVRPVAIFSILFSIHFPSCQQGEFVEQSRASIVDHSLYSHDLYVWFGDDIVRRN